MTDQQKKMFHKNYNYMWRKLNTTHYYATCDNARYSEDRNIYLLGRRLLPCYTMCSRCMNDNYEPSENTVKKIVQFYNMNLSPQISTKDYLNKELELSDNDISLNTAIFDQRYLGTFYGYYLSASVEGMVSGAILKLYEEDKIIKATMVSGIRADEELRSPDLLKLLQKVPVSHTAFEKYFNSRSLTKQCCYLYNGSVVITHTSMLIYLQGNDEDHRRLTLTFTLDGIPARNKRPYQGGLAFALSTNDGPFDARFYKIGFNGTSLGYMNINTPSIKEMLKINSSNGYSISLSEKDDRAWFEFVMASLNKNSN